MAENFYKSIIDHYPVGYVHCKVIYDEFSIVKDYEFLEINKKFQGIIEIEKEELIGQKISNVLKGRYSWIDFYNRIKNNHQDTEFDYYFEMLDQYFKVNLHYPDPENVVIFFRDTTKEVKQKESYDLFADSTWTQIWHLQDPETYGTSNKAHADFLGLKKEDIEFQKIHSFYTSEEAGLCIQVNKKVFEEKKKVVSKEWIVNSRGERRLVRVLKNPKFNQKGEVEYISCSAKDITEEYRLEEEKIIKENILYSMIHFTEELLINDDHYDALSNGIEMIGNATQVDRVYYWENHYEKEQDEWFTSQKLEWCLGGVKQQIDNPKLQNNSFEDFGDFIGILSQNKAVITQVRDMEDTVTKRVLASQGILSILILPVFVNGKFEGFIGFDSCRFEREWTDVEISLLNSFVLLYEKAVEKRLMEQHLIQVKKNFDNFFNMVNDFLIVFDKKGIIINANNTVLNKLNYSRDEIIGQPAFKLHPKDTVDRTEETLNTMLGGKVNNFSALAATKEGTTIPIETHVSKGIWDEEEVFYAVSKDVTELTRSEEKFSKAFNLSGISMVISTIEEGEFVEVNDAFLNMIGYEREDIIGKKIDNQNIFRSLSEEGNTRAKIKKEIKSNKSIYNYEIEMLSKDNKIKTGLCNIVSVNINNQLYFLTTIVDITESKLLTQELAQAKKESDMANKAKSQFLSHISHEIRTPMNAVIGYSNLLASTMLTQKQDKYIEGIKASTAMLMSIINDILDWSKIDNDGVDLETEKFNIDDVINNVVEQQRFKNSSNITERAKILVEKEDDVPNILYGDYLRLQQVLLNLLSNAVKFTEMGEIKIEVSLARKEADKVSLEFKVIDTGIGIPEELLQDIFEPFQQADNQLMSSHEGTGLGLAISEKIVKSMNGSIGVESKLNVGSTFYFTVDFEINNSTDSNHYIKTKDVCQESEVESCDRLINRRVLVVDDNQINRDVLKEILEDVGLVVTLANSGKETLEKIKTKELDVVLMDLRMPVMDGYETTNEIRKMKCSKELPIIAVSASVSPNEVKQCAEIGIHEFVTKPIQKEKLFQAIGKLLNKEGKYQKQEMMNENKLINNHKKMPKIDYEINGIDVEEALKHLNNNEDLFLRVLRRLKDNHENVVDEINQALLLKDQELAIRLVHTIKGVSGELSAAEVYSVSAELEEEMLSGSLNIKHLLKKLDEELNKIFQSEIFLEEEKEVELEHVRKLNVETIKPLLKNLGAFLLESDIDGIKYIEKVEEEAEGTFIHYKVREMKKIGQQYDFEGALSVLDEIKNMLNEKE